MKCLVHGTLLPSTSLQIDGMPVTSSTQQSVPTKLVAQQGTASQAQDTHTAMLPAEDKIKVKEMGIEVNVQMQTYIISNA